MLEEQDRGTDGRAPASGADEDAASGSRAATPPPRVEGVPSEQLWRAAILAARQAALAAADLRRALAENAGPSADDVARAPLVG